MKNLFFLSIICVAMISWAVTSTGEKANSKQVNNQEMSGACSNNNFSFVSNIDHKQCSDPMAEKACKTDQASCKKVSESKGSGSCSTLEASVGNYKFLSSEPKCSEKEDIKQCNSSPTAVNSSASL